MSRLRVLLLLHDLSRSGAPRIALDAFDAMRGEVVVCFAGGGGAPEVVGDTGVIVPDFDLQCMARAIAELAADPAEMARLGASARRRMLANYTDRVQVPRIRREVMALGRNGAADLVQPRIEQSEVSCTIETVGDPPP